MCFPQSSASGVTLLMGKCICRCFGNFSKLSHFNCKYLSLLFINTRARNVLFLEAALGRHLDTPSCGLLAPNIK